MEQLAINCKFLYVSIISKNNSQCRFFMVFEVQLILMYYLYVSCMFSLYFIFLYFRAVKKAKSSRPDRKE